MSENLPLMDMSKEETGCCPRFNPYDWDGKTFNLEGLRFIKTASRSFLYVPVNLGKVLARTTEAVDEAGAMPKDRYLILSRDVSPWRCEHYYLVEDEVAGLENATLPGNYFSKVYEGPYKDLPKWMKDMEKVLEEDGKKHGFIYAFYTTCPNCAKYYGKNYVVLMASLSQ